MNSKIVKELNFEENYPEYSDQIKHVEKIPAKAEDKVPVSNVLSSELSEKFPFDGLYSHQAKSISELNNGNDVCVTTPTSSGKTMVYALYIAQSLIDTNKTALLIYPTKALSRDQKSELDSLYQKLDLNIDIGVYDGDTDRGEKQRIRQESDIIITNFQGLNYYLPHHEKWNRIFKNLSTIVIDEAHTYTGIQGMHVSWIIRRLRRISESHYNAKPLFVLSSATIGNPREHAYNLTGREFTIISEDGSPRGRRDIIVWNPPSYEENEKLQRRSSNKESSDVLSYLISKNYQTLMFSSSRKSTEICSKISNENLKEDYVGEYKVEPYNAGHKKEDRRDVERDLKNGKLDGVVSTSALELGIDIGSVDCTVLNGYPGTRASFWQQVGRSGRGTTDTLSVLISKHASIDQYIIDNPSFLLDEDVENAVIDLSNKHVLAAHLCAAANELPLSFSDVPLFSDGELKETIEILQSNELVDGDITTGELSYEGDKRPEAEIDLYGTDDDQYSVYIKINGDKSEIPSVDKSRAFRDFHPQAIHMYKGEQYKVTEFDMENKEIYLEYVDVEYYTQSRRDVNVRDLDSKEKTTLSNDIIIHKGKSTISESYPTYSKVYFDGERDSNIPTKLTESIKLRTDAIWIEFPKKTEQEIEKASSIDGLAGSLHAAEHALIKMSPTVITADEKNMGGISTVKHPETGTSLILIYDGIQGGVGFSHGIYDNISKLSKRTNKLLNNCDCGSDHGCPACTMSHMCGDNNEPMDSIGAQKILKMLN